MLLHRSKVRHCSELNRSTCPLPGRIHTCTSVSLGSTLTAAWPPPVSPRQRTSIFEGWLTFEVAGGRRRGTARPGRFVLMEENRSFDRFFGFAAKKLGESSLLPP